MKYLCPKCGREEIVIGDAAPDCRLCRVPMLKPILEYTDLLMSPNVVLRRFKSTMEKHGWKKILTGRFKQEREACIAAIWAYGVQRITKVPEYWVEVVTMDQTPDCKVVWLDTSEGHNHRKIMNIEIVEWDEHRDSMLELIEQKCAKAYPPLLPRALRTEWQGNAGEGHPQEDQRPESPVRRNLDSWEASSFHRRLQAVFGAPRADEAGRFRRIRKLQGKQRPERIPPPHRARHGHGSD
jgi:hypothetical protein